MVKNPASKSHLSNHNKTPHLSNFLSLFSNGDSPPSYSDGDLILPIVINGDPNVDGNRITAHVMTSAHGRKNAWTGLVADALEAEQNGTVGVFYLDKAKASKVFTKLAKANPTLASVGLMYAKEPQADGVKHSITDPDSPVKGQAGLIKDQTASRQFKAWFGKSKVVDENGKPLVVYHGSSWNPMSEQSGKAVFDKSRINEGSLGRVFYFSRTPTDEYGRNLTAAYLSIKIRSMFRVIRKGCFQRKNQSASIKRLMEKSLVNISLRQWGQSPLPL